MPRLLSRGCTGLDVNELQAALNFHLRRPYTPLKPDGIFGPLTDARVREFQKRANLKPDGLVGPKTAAALYAGVGGGVVANVTVPAKSPAPGNRVAFGPRLPGFRPPVFASPTVVPLTPPAPKTGAATSSGFELSSSLLFNPLAKPSQGSHVINFGLTLTLPWPVVLPEPANLDVDVDNSDPNKPTLDAKLKVPFTKKLKTGPLSFTPYFFVGGGMEQYHFADLNAGGGGKLKLKVLKNIGGTGFDLSLQADGGGKVKYDLEKDHGEFKWFLQGGLTVGKSF